MAPMIQTDIPAFRLLKRGKVRDIFEWGHNRLLLVATDRLSAYDVVLPDPIPDKGHILHEITMFWAKMFEDIIRFHAITDQVEKFGPSAQEFKDQLEGRTILAEKAIPLKIEAIVRGYITGSGWENYLERGIVCGIKLPKNLKESQKLPEPIFTPSTKADAGKHDDNIPIEEAFNVIAKQLAHLYGGTQKDHMKTAQRIVLNVKKTSLALYQKGEEHAQSKGIIIADTKFEFGLVGDEIILIDEVLTPDSSRFWPEDLYVVGETPPSFDKQFVRDHLKSLGWNKKPPAPKLPAEVIATTTQKYTEALTRLTS